MQARCRGGSGRRSSTPRPACWASGEEEFARTIAAEAAKPIRTARVEAQRAVGTFQFAAAEARTFAGEIVPLDAIAAGEGKVGFAMRVPIGVVGAISPFNFPLNLVAHKLAPAIAAGCPVVLKPASQTPLSAVALAALLVDECGLPAEYLHVVTGGGSTVGNAIVEHPDIAMITFTGSPEVGWGIRARAPRKRVGLELGNNAPVIIDADSDWKTAAGKIRVAGFSHAGQSCISTQRVLVHRDIAEGFTSTLVDEVSTLVVGDPLDDDTEVSALISTSERDRVKSWIDEAVEQGASSPAAATIDDAGVLVPTVLTDVTPDMEVCRNEVFGPVVAVAAYDTLDEAIAPRQRHPLRPASGDLHQSTGRRDEGVRRPRLRRRARQRGADVARRPAALRRPPRQRQHPRGPRLRRPRDDRDKMVVLSP